MTNAFTAIATEATSIFIILDFITRQDFVYLLFALHERAMSRLGLEAVVTHPGMLLVLPRSSCKKNHNR